MSTNNSSLNADSAIELLLRLLKVPGLSGQEQAISDTVRGELIAVGVPVESIQTDDAPTRIDLPCELGNLYVTLPGTTTGPRIVLSTHLDTVPICAGAQPIREGNRIRTNGTTGLGGDNRTGCAVLIATVATLLKHKLPHPPLTLLFTVREESGIQGARHLNPAALSGAEMCFNFDSKVPADLITGAVGQESFTVEIGGLASHAGVAPEKGISATLVASLALADLHAHSWFGKVQQPEGKGTSNIGVFGGKMGLAAGDATNVVTDYVLLKGESRSADEAFTTKITQAYRAAFERAVEQVTSADGQKATLKFTSHAAYPPFNLADDDPVVQRAILAAKSLGLEPTTNFSNGGLDANWLVKHGLPTVTMGAGQHEIHTVKEFIDLDQFIEGCQLALAIATLASND
ncbi:MAG: peptidase [Planctomyces sp.]|nr:peptidase [Planctomyces sp.]